MPGRAQCPVLRWKTERGTGVGLWSQGAWGGGTRKESGLRAGPSPAFSLWGREKPRLDVSIWVRQQLDDKARRLGKVS